MVTARADCDHQRMYIIADQALSNDDFDILIEAIQTEARKLELGWTAAIDLRGMWVQDPFFGDQMKLMQMTILENGASRIGTLLDNSAIQMYLGQAGLKTHSNEITQRFFNEKNWEQFVSGA